MAAYAAEVQGADDAAEAAAGAQAAESAGTQAESGGLSTEGLFSGDPAEMGETAWRLIEQYGVPALAALLILFATLLAASWMRRVTYRACTKGGIEETLARFFGKMVRWLVLLVGAMFVLEKFGVDTASFAVVLGAAGLAVGLALQGTLGNFASGVMLLVFRPFKVGDYVDIGGTSGTVYEIDLFTTTLDTPDNKRVIVPNGSVYGSTITNVTFHEYRRAEVLVGTDYGEDLDKVREVLDRAAQSVSQRDEERGHQIVLASLGASSIDWKVRIWCKTSEFWPCMDAATRAVKKHLDDAGIGIPFPQMDVHLEKVEA